MFDISWGELAVLSGVGLVLIGRKDLPLASRAIGQQVGRIVGLLQGARVRADRYASDHQLKQLQNEFRSGLRELDAVKAELAGSMMPHHGSRVGMNMNNYLGATVSGVDRKRTVTTTTTTSMGVGSRIGIAQGANAATTDAISSPLNSSLTATSFMGAEYLAAAQQAEQLQGTNPNYSTNSESPITFTTLAPRSQSVAAVAEEEWEKRGIGFRSIAESGGGERRNSSMSSETVESRTDGGFGGSMYSGGGGAVILSNYLRQSLIYDQYERTIREQDEALQSRVEKVLEERTTTHPTSASDNDDNLVSEKRNA
jgi:Sec-independent protein translocase protein TatA